MIECYGTFKNTKVSSKQRARFIGESIIMMKKICFLWIKGFLGILLITSSISAMKMEQWERLDIDQFKVVLNNILTGYGDIQVLEDALKRAGCSLEWFVHNVIDESHLFPECFYIFDKKSVLNGKSVSLLTFSADSKKLAWSGRNSYKVEWCDLAERNIEEILCSNQIQRFIPLSLSFNAEGQVLLGMDNGNLLIQDKLSFVFSHVSAISDKQVLSYAVSNDGAFCAYSYDGSVFIIESSSGNYIKKVPLNRNYDEVHALKFLCSGKLIMCTREGDFLLWDSAENCVRDICNETILTRGARALTTSADYRYLAARIMNGDIFIYNVKSEKLTYSLSYAGRAIAGDCSFAFDASGLYMGYISHGNFCLKRLQDGSLVQVFSNQLDSLNSVAFSPDGQYLALGSREGEIFFARRCSKKCLSNLTLRQIIFMLWFNENRDESYKKSETFKTFPEKMKEFLESVLL